MKPQTSNLLLVPSIIDRLMNPDSNESAYFSRQNALNEIKESVRRDLEALLNTRLRVGEPEQTDVELSDTVIYYGIPDFTGASFAADVERELLRKRIEQIIMRFEPRFKRVKVNETKPIDSEDRTIRFRIEADLRIEPAVKPIVFTTTLDSITRKLNVEDADGG